MNDKTNDNDASFFDRVSSLRGKLEVKGASGRIALETALLGIEQLHNLCDVVKLVGDDLTEQLNGVQADLQAIRDAANGG